MLAFSIIFSASVGHFVARQRSNEISSCSSCRAFVDMFLIFWASFIQLKINDVMKARLVCVVTAHLVYFSARVRSEMLQGRMKFRGELR